QEDGRILRLSWSGTAEQPAIPLRPLDSWAKIRKLGDDELLKTLSADSLSDRQRAQDELRRRGQRLREPLIKLVDDGNTPLHGRCAALGVLHAFWNDDVSVLFVKMLRDPSPDLRRLAAEGLGLNPAARGGRLAALVAAMGDEDLGARREIL